MQPVLFQSYKKETEKLPDRITMETIKTKQNLSERDIVKTRYSIYCRVGNTFFLEIQNLLIPVAAYTVFTVSSVRLN